MLRDEIVSHALWGVANEKQIHYQQSRPIDGLGEPFKLPLHTDCSGFATNCYQWAGAPDPNGNDYDGQGFTGTLLAHLEHIDGADSLPGDLIVFGPGVGEHVVIATEAGANPMCVSHGQELGPIKIRLSVEAAAHSAPVTFLRGKGLDNPQEDDMTPKELALAVSRGQTDDVRDAFIKLIGDVLLGELRSEGISGAVDAAHSNIDDAVEAAVVPRLQAIEDKLAASPAIDVDAMVTKIVDQLAKRMK